VKNYGQIARNYNYMMKLKMTKMTKMKIYKLYGLTPYEIKVVEGKS
jgi:hypothetical protein